MKNESNPDVGIGYRLINDFETIEEGDQYLDDNERWITTGEWGVCKGSAGVYRRKVVPDKTKVEQMNKVSESIYTSETCAVPMAEVQHIEKLKRANEEGVIIPNGLFLITRFTRWSVEMDTWENPILIPQDESEAFLKAWCFYRYELEARATN